MGGSTLVLAVTVSGAFTFGMVIVLLSSLKPQLAARLGVAEERVAGWWAAMNLVLVPTIFFAGLLIDFSGARWVMILGSVVTALSLFTLVRVHDYKQTLLAFLGAGVGGACVSAAALVLMPRAFFGPGEASASLNMGNVFFALGALVTPALADVLLRSMGLRRTLGVLALACLAPGVLSTLVPGTHLAAVSEHPEPLSVFFSPVLWLAAAVFFFYAPLEGCLHAWGGVFLRDLGHDERRARLLIYGFWGSFLASRLLTAYLQHLRLLPSPWDPWVIVAFALGATVSLANLAGTARRGGAAGAILCLGFFLGPIFPTLVGLLFSTFPREQGTAFGAMFAIGSLGGVVFAPVITTRVRHGGERNAARVPLALGLVLMVVALVFGFAVGL